MSNGLQTQTLHRILKCQYIFDKEKGVQEIRGLRESVQSHSYLSRLRNWKQLILIENKAFFSPCVLALCWPAK